MLDFADLSPGRSAVLDVAIPLVVLALIAVMVRGVARVLFLAQVVYWGLSYVGRPLLLLAVTPKPSFGDNIADPRLARIGYDYGIAHVLEPIHLCVWVYTALAAAFLVCQRLSPPVPDPLPRQTPVTIATLVTMSAAGFSARVAMYLTGAMSKAGEVTSSNPYLSTVAALGSLGALGVILFFRNEKLWLELAVIGFFIGTELLWGIASESKSPFMGAMLALAVRYLSTGVSRAKLVAIVAGAIVVAGLFGWLQSLKSSQRATHMANEASLTYNLSYPEEVRSYLPIFRRFDLLEAATDLYYYGDQRPRMGVGDIAQNALLDLVPAQLGATKVQSGVSWAQDVRGASVNMRGISVSLAEGHLSEGYLAGGLGGVALESLFVIGMIGTTARCLRSRKIVLLVALGVTNVALPSLFERGMLGIAETVGKALEQGLIAGSFATAIWLFAHLRARARGKPIPIPEPVHQTYRESAMNRKELTCTSTT